MGFGNIAIMTGAMALGQSPDTPSRPSSAGNISDSSGSEVTSSGSGAKSTGAQSGSPFRPGQVRVDDSRGTEVTSTGGPGGKPTAFKPGQVRVDDTRGTEVRNNNNPPPAVFTPPSPPPIVERRLILTNQNCCIGCHPSAPSYRGVANPGFGSNRDMPDLSTFFNQSRRGASPSRLTDDEIRALLAPKR